MFLLARCAEQSPISLGFGKDQLDCEIIKYYMALPLHCISTQISGTGVVQNVLGYTSRKSTVLAHEI